MSDTKPLLKARKEVEISLSPIWFLPIIAVVISVWLLVKLNLESKVPITIQMTTAQGITPGKTLIKFRGINAGKVTKIEVSENLAHVDVLAVPPAGPDPAPGPRRPEAPRRAPPPPANSTFVSPPFLGPTCSRGRRGL